MVIGVAFLLYALALLGWAWSLQSPALSVLLALLGAGFLAPAAAWLGAGPMVFGKRADGGQAPLAVLLSASYLLLSALVFHLGIRLLREDPLNEITEGVHVGRRPLARDTARLTGLGINTVLDLTAETPARFTGTTYRCLPVLDHTPPTQAQLAEAAAFIAARPGPVLVHCAAGHGRSATAVAAWLLHRDPGRTVAEVQAQLQRSRPGIRLSAGQRAALETFRKSL